MIYMGSKARYAEEIIAIATAHRKPNQPWVEPFVGGGNIICRVPAQQGPRIGGDVNWRMIELLDAIGNQGWVPPENVTEEQYKHIKENPDSYPPELVAFVATAVSFGAKWFAGYARGSVDYAANGAKQALREAPLLHGAKFVYARYDELSIPRDSIIYCDPPYTGTTGYGGAKTDIDIGDDLALNTWNRAAFWRWADKMVAAGHDVFVSEYTGPPASIYKPSAELKRLRAEAGERYRIVQNDKSSPEALHTAFSALQAIDERISKEAEKAAARWEVLWQKEVVGDFDARGDNKREIEKLFHRRAGT